MPTDRHGYYNEHYSYKLRSSGAVPVGRGVFLAQIFGVDRNRIRSYEAATQLPDTCDFMGASLTGQYMQASFQRLPYLTNAGQQIFNGSITFKTEFLNTMNIPGQGGF